MSSSIRPAVVWGALICVCLVLGCGPGEAPVAKDQFSVLSYNVAALPEGLSSSDPERTIPLISPRLNDWDLVLVQEDFAYQRELRADVTHPYQSAPKDPEVLALGDGLNRFSSLEFDELVHRERWATCNGLTGGSNDCLAEKGYSVGAHKLPGGGSLVVVNLHMDAGGGQDDRDARAEQVEQLITYLDANHADDALLVGGDTNTRPSRPDADDASVLARMLDGLGLHDACEPIACGELDRIDRILLRSSAALDVVGASYRIADELVDDAGDPLSDHDAVEVVIEAWSQTGSP